MGRYVVEEYREIPPIPDGKIFPARVIKVEEIEKDKRGGGGKYRKMKFSFRLSAPGTEWDDLERSGEVFARLDSGEENEFRIWCESLLGYDLPVGYELDTDSFENMQCKVEMGSREYIKDGKTRTYDFVRTVLPFS